MKRDEDVWISLGTKASRPDEFWPDQGSRVADRALQAGQDRRRGRGENRVLTLTSPQTRSPSSSDGSGDLRVLP